MVAAEILGALISGDGAFTFDQARRSGVSAAELRRLLSTGDVRRLGRDMYTIARAPTDLLTRHRELLSAAAHKYGDRVAAINHSALIAHGLPAYDADLSVVHLQWRDRTSTRRVGALQIQRSAFTFPEIITADGLPAVTETVAFFQASARIGLVTGVVAGDAITHRQSSSIEQLEQVSADFPTYPGRARAERAARLIDPRSESPGESILRVITHQAGIALEPQFAVYAGHRQVARADFRVTGTRLLLEFDGRIKYLPDHRASDPNALWKEKQREDLIRRQGFGIERVVWGDLQNPKALLARIRSAAARWP